MIGACCAGASPMCGEPQEMCCKNPKMVEQTTAEGVFTFGCLLNGPHQPPLNL